MKKFFSVDDYCKINLTERKKSSSLWTDMSKSANHATAYGSIQTSRLGYIFDGVDDYFNIPSYIGVSSITMMAWIDGHGNGRVFSCFDKQVLNGAGGGYLVTTSINNTVNTMDDKWHLICLTYNGSTVLLYTDGIQTKTQALSVTISGSNAIQISSDRGIDVWFTGLISNPRLYSRVLSASEILNHYGKTRKFYGV